MKKVFPWWLKLFLKLVFARIPANYKLWKNIDLFSHGSMNKPEYAFKIFKKHYDRSNFSKKSQGFVFLELGPGDSLFSAYIANLYGCSKSYLVDTGKFADNSDKNNERIIEFLKIRNPKFSSKNTNYEYLTKGLDSLKGIQTASIDFIMSQAVLEHIRKNEFKEHFNELRRILKPDGMMSHEVDLRDHLGGSLNNLRFKDDFWEKDWVARSGFYTNRIRYNEMLKIFSDAGFEIKIINTNLWEKIPIEKKYLFKRFKNMQDENFLVQTFDVLLKPT